MLNGQANQRDIWYDRRDMGYHIVEQLAELMGHDYIKPTAQTSNANRLEEVRRRVNEQWRQVENLILEINIEPMNKTYISQKDLPGYKAGTIFRSFGKSDSCTDDWYIAEVNVFTNIPRPEYHKSIVENNPEWFKLKGEAKEFTESQLKEAFVRQSGIVIDKGRIRNENLEESFQNYVNKMRNNS